MIHVIAIITAKPGKRNEVLGHFRANVPAVRAEKGCIDYGATVDTEGMGSFQTKFGPDTFVVVEKWESTDALKAHAAAPHMAAYAAKTRDNIKALGVSTLKPLPQLPNVPTIDSAGLKGYDVSIWNGFFGPKGMAKENIAKVNEALVKTLGDANVSKRLTELAVDLPSKEESTPDALRTQLKASIDKWVPAVKAAGVKPE
jgi:quinol monooxygenase YgiN